MVTSFEREESVRALIKAPGGVNVLAPLLDDDNAGWVDSVRQDYPDAIFERRVITTITSDWEALK